METSIIFDLGKVLIGFDPYHTLLDIGYSHQQAIILYNSIFNDEIWQKGDEGLYTTEEEAKTLFIKKHPLHKDLIEAFFATNWKDYIFTHINPQLFLKAKEKGLKIYLLTNFASYGFDHIARKYDFISQSDGYVVSGKVKMFKPNPDIYLYLLNKYGLKAEECLFFDDNPQNINTAKSFGIKAHLFTDPDEALKIIEKAVTTDIHQN